MNCPGKAVFLIVLAAIGFLAVGCGAAPEEAAIQPVPTLAETAVIPTTPHPTATLNPPPTPEILPTATHTRPPTAVPTATPTPTATPLPTALPTPCPLPGGIEHGLFTSPIAGEKSYRIYLPPCYGQDNRLYPVLYMLAGNTYTDAIWDQLGLDEAAEAGIQSGAYPPIIIVMPYSGETALYTSGGPNSYETVILEDLTRHIETTYCASSDPQFRALGGLSRGGYWALEIAFRHPDAFRSVGGHSAALLDEYAKPDVNPQYTALSNDLGDLRIYLDIGDQDWVRANTLQLHADMAAANIPHTWVLNEGHHEEAYWEAHVAEYLAWYTEPWSPDRSDYPLCNLP